MDYFLKASVIIILFYVCYKLFLQRETYFQSNRWFLLIGLILATVLPLVVIPIYIDYTPVLLTVSETNQFSSQPIIENLNNINYWEIFAYAYIAGMLFFIIRLTTQFGSLISLFKRHKKTKKEQFYFVETEADIAPFSFFNRIVFNPNQFTPKELNHIITHEKIHAKQLHSLDVIITQIATVLFWFNPFIWWYKKELQQNLEFIADQKAQHQIACAKSYQTVLLKASLSQNKLALSNNFYQSLIKKRIIMLQKSKSKTISYLKLAIVLPFLALFLMSFNVEEIILPIENETNIKNVIEDIEVAIISKDATDSDLKEIVEQFKKQGVTLSFKGVKRNKSNEIIRIKISAESNNSKTKYEANSDEPISNIKIKYDSEENSVTIGNQSKSSNSIYISSDNGDYKGHKIKKSKSYAFVVKDDDHDHKDGEEHEDQEEHEIKVIVKDGEHKIKISGDDIDQENVFILQGDGDNKVLELNGGTEDVTIIKDEDGNVTKKIIRITGKSEGKNTWIEKDGETKEIRIRIDKDGNQVKEIINLNDDGTQSWIDVDNQDFTVTKDKDGKTIKKKIIIKSNDGDNTWTEKDGNVLKVESNGKEQKMLFISSDNDKSPLIFIDGKESSMEVMEKLSPDAIKSMNVLKGKSAIKMYGDKGKDGVVEITTKK